MGSRRRSVALSLLLAAGAMLLHPDRAEACAEKRSLVHIVLGVAAEQVVSVRLELRQTSEADLKAYWVGHAWLQVGEKFDVDAPLGTIDPKANASKEVDRLVALGRAQAEKLAGFTAAKRVSATDCADEPKARCGDVALDKNGVTLRVGKVRAPHGRTADDAEGLGIVGVVRYKAGKTEIAVVNLGSGDPRFSDSVKTCEGGPCRLIWVLHHGEQDDLIVVTKAP